MNIRVFRRGERTDRPAKVIVSKSTAKRYLYTGRFIQLSPSSIQEVTAPRRAPSSQPARIVRPAAPYIPDRLPAMDIPGVKFREPNTDAWRLAHRNVEFAEYRSQMRPVREQVSA